MSEKPDTPEQPAEKKIDEGWKAQVEEEREAFGRGSEEEPQAAGEAGGGESATILPASLTMLVSSLAAQGMIALGLVAEPGQQKPAADLDLARHFIDLLAMLEEKTQGNRTPAEHSMLEAVLHQLRLAYLAAGQSGRPAEQESAE